MPEQEDFTMRYFLGLDVAKDTFAAALLDEAGQVVATASFGNHLEGFHELLAWLPAAAQTIGVCEPTGVYNQHLKQTLATALESLHEINAQTLKQFAFSQVRTKTDQADALAIAEAARVLSLSKPEILVKTRVSWNPQRENLALWLAEYDRLRKAIAMLRQQIAELAHHAAPDARKVQNRRAQELKRLLAQQEQVKDKIELVYRELDDAQARILDSIPGIGPLSTAVTLVVVRDVKRFRSADSLKAYLGIYPRRNQSGTRERRSHLAHHGNKLMRHVLWNAAKAAVKVKHADNPFRHLFERLLAKGRSYNHAIGAVCRKLVQVIYGVLKSQTPFHYPASTS
jgi:transposase